MTYFRAKSHVTTIYQQLVRSVYLVDVLIIPVKLVKSLKGCVHSK